MVRKVAMIITGSRKRVLRSPLLKMSSSSGSIKTIKIKKLDDYVAKIASEHILTPAESLSLRKYLATSLDRKKLQRVKDVIYDKTTGSIKNIPSLHFNTTTRKFTLKRSEKRVSTLKSLGKGKTRKNNKIDGSIKDK